MVNYSPLDAARCSSTRSRTAGPTSWSRSTSRRSIRRWRRCSARRGSKKLIVGSIADIPAVARRTGSIRSPRRKELSVWPRDDCAHVVQGSARQRRQVHGACRSARICGTRSALLQYTGGTTGLPKGAMLTHGCVAVGDEPGPVLGDALHHARRREGACCVLPLFHIYALSGIMLGARAQRQPAHPASAASTSSMIVK